MRFFVYILFFLLIGNTANADNLLKEASYLLTDKRETDKLVMMTTSRAKNIILENYEKISQNCCEANFGQAEKVKKIKITLEKCIDKKCFSNMIPIWRKGNPPTKAISLAYARLVDDIITQNLKFKYENEIDAIVKQKENENEIAKLKNETDIEKIKIQFEQKLIIIEKENSNLKNTIEKMLINYQNQISNLKDENKILSSNFDKAYNLVPKSKRKKLEEEIE